MPSARMAYERLEQIAPEIASRYDYLSLRGDDATRAARAGGVEGTVLWGEGK